MIGKHCIVRTQSAGVFAGTLQSREGQEVTLTDARRLWYWDGAASLSQLAVSGVSKGSLPAKPSLAVKTPLPGP